MRAASICLYLRRILGHQRDGTTSTGFLLDGGLRDGSTSSVRALFGRAELAIGGYSVIEGSCRSGEVIDYLDALAEKAQREGKLCVVVLDNAPFHTAGAIREREAEWEAKGLRLYRLPSYCARI